MDLASAAETVYGGSLTDFVATRTALTKDARAASDRDLAAAIAALRKPTTAAWVVNMAVRGRRAAVDAVLDLGDELRAAQRAMDGPRMRELSSRAADLVGGAVRAAIDAAGTHGQVVSDSVATDVEQTFRAAMADEDAATAVRTGRLVAALPPSGLAGLDLTAVVDTIGAPPPRRLPKRPATKASPPAAERADAATERARRADAEALAAARRELAATAARVTELEVTLRTATERVEAGRRELATATRAQAGAERELAAAREALSAAHDAVAAADRTTPPQARPKTPSRRGESNP